MRDFLPRETSVLSGKTQIFPLLPFMMLTVFLAVIERLGSFSPIQLSPSTFRSECRRCVSLKVKIIFSIFVVLTTSSILVHEDGGVGRSLDRACIQPSELHRASFSSSFPCLFLSLRKADDSQDFQKSLSQKTWRKVIIILRTGEISNETTSLPFTRN